MQSAGEISERLGAAARANDWIQCAGGIGIRKHWSEEKANDSAISRLEPLPSNILEMQVFMDVFSIIQLVALVYSLMAGHESLKTTRETKSLLETAIRRILPSENDDNTRSPENQANTRDTQIESSILSNSESSSCRVPDQGIASQSNDELQPTESRRAEDTRVLSVSLFLWIICGLASFIVLYLLMLLWQAGLCFEERSQFCVSLLVASSSPLLACGVVLSAKEEWGGVVDLVVSWVRTQIVWLVIIFSFCSPLFFIINNLLFYLPSMILIAIISIYILIATFIDYRRLIARIFQKKIPLENEHYVDLRFLDIESINEKKFAKMIKRLLEVIMFNLTISLLAAFCLADLIRNSKIWLIECCNIHFASIGSFMVNVFILFTVLPLLSIFVVLLFVLVTRVFSGVLQALPTAGFVTIIIWSIVFRTEWLADPMSVYFINCSFIIIQIGIALYRRIMLLMDSG